MPTGYTAALYEGEQSFEDYVWGVARGFGALISMRDEPRDAPIPNSFEPDTGYHDRAIEQARASLRELDSMTVEEAARRAHADHAEAVQRRDEAAAVRAALRERYEAMLEKVRAWEPPTADHLNLKETMVEQLEKAIDFDCGMDYWEVESERTAQEWVDHRRKRAERDVAYHVAEREKELERARGRTAWTQALRESLRGVPA